MTFEMTWADSDHTMVNIELPTGFVGWIPVGQDSYAGMIAKELLDSGVVPAPYQPGPIPPDHVVPVPTVTKVQAMIALHRAGKLDAVKAAVATDPESQLWFDNAQTWRRDNPRIIALAPQVGLSDADLDELFRVAATVTA
jgi:hypothetical protein